jgi:hypothetical protein
MDESIIVLAVERRRTRLFLESSITVSEVCVVQVIIVHGNPKEQFPEGIILTEGEHTN